MFQPITANDKLVYQFEHGDECYDFNGLQTIFIKNGLNIKRDLPNAKGIQIGFYARSISKVDSQIFFGIDCYTNTQRIDSFCEYILESRTITNITKDQITIEGDQWNEDSMNKQYQCLLIFFDKHEDHMYPDYIIKFKDVDNKWFINETKTINLDNHIIPDSILEKIKLNESTICLGYSYLDYVYPINRLIVPKTWTYYTAKVSLECKTHTQGKALRPGTKNIRFVLIANYIKNENTELLFKHFYYVPIY